jgi:hypothetical protein
MVEYGAFGTAVRAGFIRAALEIVLTGLVVLLVRAGFIRAALEIVLTGLLALLVRARAESQSFRAAMCLKSHWCGISLYGLRRV